MYDPYPKRAVPGLLWRVLGLGFCSFVLLALAVMLNVQSRFLSVSTPNGTGAAELGGAQLDPDASGVQSADLSSSSPPLIVLYPKFVPQTSELPPMVPVPDSRSRVQADPPQGSAPSAPVPNVQGITPGGITPGGSAPVAAPPAPSNPSGTSVGSHPPEPAAPEPKGGNGNQPSGGGGSHGNGNGSGNGNGKGHK